MAEKKNGGRSESGPSVAEFADRIVKKLTEMLTSGGKSPLKDLEDIDLPEPCGPETEKAIEELGASEPITRLRRIVIVKPGDAEAVADDKDEVEDHMRRLMAARNRDFDNGVRQIFAAVHQAKTEGDGDAQLRAVRLLDSLIREASDDERDGLESARKSVLAGTDTDLDAATFRVRQVFASRVGPGNVRLAYTSLATQFGEGYQLCPKAAHQIGKAIPMELSKCRDNCIDSRTTRDGHVTCAYADWLRRAADNHKAVEDRLERVQHDLNKETLGTLKDGERSKPETVKSIEGQMDEIRAKYPEHKDESIEASFADKSVELGHRENPIKRIQDMLLKSKGEETMEEELGDARENGLDYDDSTLEQMLEDEHHGIEDSDLDMLVEELLDSARPEK